MKQEHSIRASFFQEVSQLIIITGMCFVCARPCACMCVCACVRACVLACVRACVHALGCLSANVRASIEYVGGAITA